MSDARGMYDPLPRTPVLTPIDLAAQVRSHNALKGIVSRLQADAAAAITIDVATGQVRTLIGTEVPDSGSARASKLQQLHPAVLEVEPGVTIEPIVFAALAQKLGHDVSGYERLLNRYLGSRRSKGGSSTKYVDSTRTADAFVDLGKVSGVGALALNVPPRDLWEVLHAVGVDAEVPAFGPAARQGRLPSGERWTVTEHIEIGRGRGLKLTPAQLGRALAVVARGGDFRDLAIEQDPAPSKQQARQGLTRDASSLAVGAVSIRDSGDSNPQCAASQWLRSGVHRSVEVMSDRVIRSRLLVAAGWCLEQPGKGLVSVMVAALPADDVHQDDLEYAWTVRTLFESMMPAARQVKEGAKK